MKEKMDTSKQYIRMCDCPKIQGRWMPAVGDWANRGIIAGIHSYRPKSSHQIMINAGQGWTHSYWNKQSLIWLPLQWQLQEMVWDHTYSDAQYPWQTISVFFKWTRKVFSQDYADTSMEQLWLAFVMHELYQKRWTGEKWEKEGGQ